MGDKYKIKAKGTKYGGMLSELENYMESENKSCENSCIFCFVDQLPQKGLREALYFKDDDEKLSFLFGNYITLTNLEERHIDRIIKMRISPVNISVHTTNPALRVKMMGNSRAGEVLDYIKKLADGGININAQIVLCKNINDGAELEKTLTDLCALYPAVQSIAAVPCGLTKYRGENKLANILPFGAEDCKKIINQVNKFKPKPVYCADEFYLSANLKVPDAGYYGDYPQYENGVGIIRSFCDDFYREIKNFTKNPPPAAQQIRKVSVATGEAAYPIIKTLAGEITRIRKNLICGVYKIKNDFFGREITVAGLVTGRDIIAQLTLQKTGLGSELLIPAVMLRYERDLFLDDINVKDIENALGVKVKIVENNAADFIKSVYGGYQD